MSCDTREKIINSASALFYASSYSDVGVQAICNHAGVKKGSFYHFFSSKNDLVIAVLEMLQQQVVASMLQPAFEADIPPLERFERLAQCIHDYDSNIQQQLGHVMGCPFGNLAIELSAQNAEVRQSVSAFFDVMKAFFVEALEEAQETGDIGLIDIEASAESLVAFFEGIALLSKTRNDPTLVLKLIPIIKNFFL